MPVESDGLRHRAPPVRYNEGNRLGLWLIASPPDANWKAPYSARFHVGASAPGG